MDFPGISETLIASMAPNPEIDRRGKMYAQAGKVFNFSVNEQYMKARVSTEEGSFNVIIYPHVDKLNCTCDCPAESHVCKHVTAVLHHWLSITQTSPHPIQFSSQNAVKKDLRNLNLPALLQEFSSEDIHQALLIQQSAVFKLSIQENRMIQTELTLAGRTYKTAIHIINPFASPPTLSWRCTCRDGTQMKCEHVIASLIHYFRTKRNDELPADFWDQIRIQSDKLRLHQLIQILQTHSYDTSGESQLSREYKVFFRLKNKQQELHLSFEKAPYLKTGGVGKHSPASYEFLRNYYFDLPESFKKVFSLIFLAQTDSERRTIMGIQGNTVSRVLHADPLDMEILKNLRALYAEDPTAIPDCILPKEKGNLEIEFSRYDSGTYQLLGRIQLHETLYVLNPDDVLLFGQDTVWYFSAGDTAKSSPLSSLTGFEISSTNPVLLKKINEYLGLIIPYTQLNEFIEKHYLHLRTLGFVVLPDYLDIEEKAGTITKIGICLRDYQSAFAMDLKFNYGPYASSFLNDFDIIYQDSSHRLVKIIRDREKEKKYAHILLENRVRIQDDLLLPAVDPVEWLTTWAPSLIRQGFEIFGQDTLLNQRLIMHEPRLRLEVSTGMDWFDLKLDFEIGGFHPSLSTLAQALIHHQRYIRLSNGSLGIIPEHWITRLAGIIGFLNQSKTDQRLRASRTQLEIIDSLIQVADKVKTDQSYDEFSHKVKNYQTTSNPPLPVSLKGSLRDYQIAGYHWLHFLKEFSYGGCLADEMGLGKTVQALSILLYEKEQGIKTLSLIVVPTTLIFNWLMEIEKFTPNLNVQVHHGTERCKDLEDYAAEGVDTILTTYGIVRNDIELFANFDFHYIILDESQQIKNPLSKNAQCIFRLKTRHRLSLTGTPIENNSLDLWSQFNFLNPGMLGTIEFFRNTFTREIEIEQNSLQADRLRQLITPFLLLRKKNMVAKELPDKQYIYLYAEMEPQQRELYDEWKMSYRYKIMDSVKNKGFNQSRMLILQGLIRLRQICNHPRLVDPAYTGESSKFNLLIEQIEDAISQDHKVLIFSSFVKMLAIFRQYFDQQGTAYCYLDGSTRNRKEVVENFQQNHQIRVFLISLKAGGVGLNLTAADYVFMVDPWWNPAAEMQAIDRTHRIGQTRHVFIYKAITRSSVEEKILKLQEKKLKLVSSIITPEETIFKFLSMDDIYSFFND